MTAPFRWSVPEKSVVVVGGGVVSVGVVVRSLPQAALNDKQGGNNQIMKHGSPHVAPSEIARAIENLVTPDSHGPCDLT